MGSAITIFEGATAIKVPKTRFTPIKRCQDLLGLMSDCYVMTEDSRVIQNPHRRLEAIKIDLDDRYYRKIDQLQERFPHGVPSLIDCRSLKVEGNVYFGRGIMIKGDVTITNALSKEVSIPEGTVIDKDLLFD